MTVLEQSVGWEAAVRSQEGDEALALVLAALNGYEMALDFMTRNVPINESWIRQIHETVCAPQKTYTVYTPLGPQEQPLPLGVYKTQPNHVRLTDGLLHAYAPVSETKPEMERLIDQLREPAFEGAHPAVQATYVHHAFTVIHPFADGNGRVARILASVFLLREAQVPFVVFADERVRYYDCLSLADRGQPQPLVNFVIDHAIDTIGYLLDLLAAESMNIAPADLRLRALHLSYGDLPFAEIDAIAVRLSQFVFSTLNEKAAAYALPQGVKSGAIGATYPLVPIAKDCRLVAQSHGIPIGGLFFSSAEPAKATVRVVFDVVISRRKEDRYPFILRYRLSSQRSSRPSSEESSVETIRYRLDELNPAPTEGFRLRLDAWARKTVAEMLNLLVLEATAVLESEGLTET